MRDGYIRYSQKLRFAMEIKRIFIVIAIFSISSIVQADGISKARSMLSSQADEVSGLMATLSPGDINACVIQNEIVSATTRMRLTGRSRPEAIRNVIEMDLGLSPAAADPEEHAEIVVSGAIARVNEVYDLDIVGLSLPLPKEEAELRASLLGEEAFNNCIKIIHDHKQSAK